jgi:hypothetical protein
MSSEFLSKTSNFLTVNASNSEIFRSFLVRKYRQLCSEEKKELKKKGL